MPDHDETRAGAWAAMSAELDRAASEGRRVRVWLRDDDAVEITPALERLDRLCADAGMPILLAVIPAAAAPNLAAWTASRPSLVPCQHGYAHANHAPPGARACELGGGRPLGAIEAELRAGRARLQALFGTRLSDMLVPPWNRIEPALVPRLPALGFDGLSVFGPPEGEGTIRRVNADLDIIDWRHGRVGRTSEDVGRKLAGLVATGDGTRPIGLLTHHLAHDEAAWTVLGAVLSRLRRHPAVTFVSASEFR